MSDRFYSARISLCSDETHARCTLFELIKALARTEEKLKQEQETGNTRYACGLRVQESIGIHSVRIVIKLSYYINVTLSPWLHSLNKEGS